MDVAEIDLRGLRMAPDGVTAAVATMPPPVAPGLARRAEGRALAVDPVVVEGSPTGHEFTTPWQLPALSAEA